MKFDLKGSSSKVWNWLVSQWRKTLLTRFCEKGNIGIVKFLLKLKFNVNKIDGNGKSPLWAVVTSKFVNNDKAEELINLLSENGANLEERYDNKDLLKYTLDIHDLSAMKALIRNGIDVNHVYEDGKNILWGVVENKNISLVEKLELLKLLKDFNIDMSHSDREGKTVLWEVVKNLDNRKELLSELVSLGIDINKKDNEGNSLCTYAILNKDELLQKLLIENGVKLDIDTSSVGQVTRYFSNPDIQKKLVNAGLFLLKKVVSESNILRENQAKWINIGLDAIRIIIKNPYMIGRIESIFGEAYKDVKVKLKSIFKSNIKRTFKTLSQNIGDVTNFVLDKADTSNNISDVVVKTIDYSLNKVIESYDESLKDANKILIDTSKGVIDSVIDDLKKDSKDEIFVHDVSSFMNGMVSKVSNKLDIKKDALVKIVTNVSKGVVNCITQKLSNEYKGTQVLTNEKDYLMANYKKMQMLRSKNSKNYYKNRIKDLERFFGNPDKQEKWKDAAISNIKLVINAKEGIKLLSKENRASLREKIIDFIRVEDRNDELKTELKKLCDCNNELRSKLENEESYKLTNEQKIQCLSSKNSRNYYSNRIRNLERFFGNPDKQGKWKDAAISNIKLVVNAKEGIKLLRKENRASLRKKIIDFIRVNDKNGKLKTELKKLSEHSNRLRIA